MKKIKIIFDNNSNSLKIKNQIEAIFKKNEFPKKNVVIVIGGDGFMLKILKKNKKTKQLFYGINSVISGFWWTSFKKKFDK